MNIKFELDDDRITNVEIRRRLNVKENIMQLIMERKLGLFEHIYLQKIAA